MGFSKDQLLARFQELQIDFSRYDHPVVLTVEAQEKHIGHVGGGISKNLFLKDKKHRSYVVSALSGTTVDLKVLSQRLGLGKAGLRMAPEEALQEILQVPLGCVTPFALINDSARNVSLLLDQGFKVQECCFFHPLSNDVSISLKASDLDKFLISIGREPSYVDFKAEVTVGKDQPPDLAALVPSAIPDAPGKTVPQKPTSENHLSVSSKPEIITGESVKQQSNHTQSMKGKSVQQPPNHTQSLKGKSVQQPPNILDVEYFVDQIIEKTSSLVLSQITSVTIQQHGKQLGGVVADAIRKNLSKDFESFATQFKNVAYTEGFCSAVAAQSEFAHSLNKRCLP